MFTRSKCPSAPVDWCRAQLKQGTASALVVNSGNANAFTGKSGREATKLTAKVAAAAAGCKPSEIFLASTGVIGEPLDATKFGGVMDQTDRHRRSRRLGCHGQGDHDDGHVSEGRRCHGPAWRDAGHRIGIAKGAGMIAPDMATMLSFVFTDAPIAPTVLQNLLKEGVADTFNAVTIDGDTSTSDTLLAFATGAAAARGDDENRAPFRPAAAGLPQGVRCRPRQPGRAGRARWRRRPQARRDHRRGCVSKPSARKIALSIANSPLVKTAIAGEDANWGRVVMAVGKAGEPRGPRPTFDLVRRHPRRPQGRARPGLRRGRRSPRR